MTHLYRFAGFGFGGFGGGQRILSFFVTKKENSNSHSAIFSLYEKRETEERTGNSHAFGNESRRTLFGTSHGCVFLFVSMQNF